MIKVRRKLTFPHVRTTRLANLQLLEVASLGQTVVSPTPG